MTIHIMNDALVVAELPGGETPEPESIKRQIFAAQEHSGGSRWHSMELQLFEGREGTLVFAVPVRVFLPECLLRLAGGI